MSLTAVQQSEMVKRVGRAIVVHFESGGAYVGTITPDLTSVSINGVEMDIRALARVAIAAIREPTETMVEAAVSQHYGYDIDDDDKRDGARNIWRAMIDAALCP